ncbi:TetR/AcrR family transcriptional regulator [Ancylobacter amanitiformis]|uniref:AcrR family transcriptional regulator n=1 Tax=Ancylobacter amanitiformis TaxID=217069 RepID=A0ABU0LTE8_9HYPH|nr:TetR/AcrR family transcriptional regulator [Ancylobacter amanitiformis]MDQ0511966.1 AcrR family transcriptional regulator [Ancylobacter amanitiformis]
MSARGQPAPTRRVSRAAVPRRGRDGTATRARIEAEALTLFAEKGIDGTSVRDIALRAGLSEGALYRHFPSKEELARELFLSHYATLARAICAVDARDVGLAEKLRDVVALACRLFDEEPALFAYLLIHQHDHLRHVPATPDANVVEAVALLLRGGGLAPERAALASAMALGCVVQPAVFALYGRLEGPLAAHADAIARAVTGVVEGARGA